MNNVQAFSKKTAKIKTRYQISTRISVSNQQLTKVSCRPQRDADETALFQFNRKVKINPAVLRHLVVVDQQ